MNDYKENLEYKINFFPEFDFYVINYIDLLLFKLLIGIVSDTMRNSII